MFKKLFPKRDYYNAVLIKLAKIGLARRVMMTDEFERIFPYKDFDSDSIFTRDDAILLFVKEMELNKHIRYHTVTFKSDTVHPNDLPDVVYELRITVDGLDYINKVRDRVRWKLGILLTIIAIIIAFAALFKDFKKDTKPKPEQVPSIQSKNKLEK